MTWLNMQLLHFVQTLVGYLMWMWFLKLASKQVIKMLKTPNISIEQIIDSEDHL